MQSTAALECEVWEVTVYGPGHHLGSNGTDDEARDFLAPIAEVIDSQSVLERYQMVLHLLKRNSLNRGGQPWQDASISALAPHALPGPRDRVLPSWMRSMPI